MKPWSEGIALALIAGPWTLDEMVRRTEDALDQKPAWIRPLCVHVLQGFRIPPGEDELPDPSGSFAVIFCRHKHQNYLKKNAGIIGALSERIAGEIIAA